MCADNQESLSKVRGVQEVRTAVMLNRVIVDYDPGEADVTEIRMAVEKAGFKALYVSERGYAPDTSSGLSLPDSHWLFS